MLGVRRAAVVKQVIVRADFLIDLCKIRLHKPRNGFVMPVCRFSDLKKRIRILRLSPLERPLRIQRVFAEFPQGIHRKEIAQVFLAPDGNLLNFMRRPEAVKKADKRNSSFYGRPVRRRR